MAELVICKKQEPGEKVNRRKLPKSRNGCFRCKAKRAKCDEAKPHCQECRKRNIQCPGYPTPKFRWSTKHQETTVPAKHERSTPSQIQSLTPPPEGQTQNRVAEFKKDRAHKEFETSIIQFDEFVAWDHQCLERTPELSYISPILEAQQFDEYPSPEFQLSNPPPIPTRILYYPTIFVEHYFTAVCPILSVFDGPKNQFRSRISDLWQSSASIFYAIQSMGSALLIEDFPQLGPIGRQLHKDAVKHTYQDVDSTEKSYCFLERTVLSLMLVGFSASWHDYHSQAVKHFQSARLLNDIISEQNFDNTADGELEGITFLNQCFVHLDMILSFACGDKDFSSDVANRASSPISVPRVNSEMIPHPWTGTASDIQILFGGVGQLIQAVRNLGRPRRSKRSQDIGVHERDVWELGEIISKAESFEEKLLSYEPPLHPIPFSSTLCDEGPDEYALIAEAYRCVSLLEIYRSFPSILRKRTPLIGDSSSILVCESSGVQGCHVLNVSELGASNFSSKWLVLLAIHIVSILESLPPKSGTSFLQPLILVAVACELRYIPPNPKSSDHSNSPSTLKSPEDAPADFEVKNARMFVTKQIEKFRKQLPAKNIEKVECIVQETWRKLDLGEECFWMDVMTDNGWNTIFR